MKIVLAGAETWADLLLGLKAPNILMTYYYLRKQAGSGVDFLKKAKAEGAWIIVDSGAFTFKKRFSWLREDITIPGSDGMSRYPDRHPQKELDEARETENNISRAQAVEEMRAYLDGYCSFLEKAAVFSDAFAELDVESIVGNELVWEWRERLVAASGNAVEKIIISPHHRLEDREEMNRITSRFKYLGLGRRKDGLTYSSFFTEWLPVLKKNKIKVHGWALTTFENITQLPFYSVDSTTWLMGGKFGTTYVYDGSLKLDSHDSSWKHNRRSMRLEAELAGADFDKFIADVPDEVHKVNAYQWIKYARDMESYLVNAYWIDESDKIKIIANARAERGLSGPITKRDRYGEMLRAGSGPALSIGRLCNTCFLSQSCTVYEANASCAVAARPDIQNDADMERVANAAIGIQYERFEFASFGERVLGAPISPETGREGKALMDMMRAKKEMFDSRDSIKIEAKGSGGGVLSRMFASFGQKKPETEQVVVEPVEPEKDAENATIRPVEETDD